VGLRRRRPQPGLPEPFPVGQAHLRLAGQRDDGDGPSNEEVASAVDRVRRQVVARYSAAEADRDELASILDAAFDAFVGVDDEGRITRWNSRAERLFGWSRQEAIGRPVLGTAIGSPAGEDPLRPEDLWMLAAGQSDEPAELLAWDRTGRAFPVEVALSVTDDGEEPTIQAFVRDISRRQARERRDQVVHAVTRALAHADTLEQASVELLEELGTAYEWVAGTTWVLDEADGHLRPLATWSGDAPRLHHWADACATTRLEIGTGLPGQAWHQGGVANCAETGTSEDDPRAAASARAGLRAAVCLPLLIEGEVVGVIELVGPVRRRIERLLLDDLVAIQQVVASFIERRRARAETERAKHEFLTLVSHELRTPLTSILGYVQMLDARLADAGEAERRSVEIIGRNADRLHRLVGDLLFAAEVSRGELGLEQGAVCLRTLLRDAADAARPVAGARHIDIKVDADPVGAVEGDAGRLAQVLDNLLSNAIKFSHAGGQVVLRLREAGEGVEVAVTDEGIGIPAAEMSQLTKQFFRASTARAAQVPGMGLGLSLSRSIVEAHGGLLWMTSVEGQGTTVTVTLPSGPTVALAA
jgi:PAS domain S-box-containing protein